MTCASLNQAQRQDLGASLKGNLCRCTGYRAIEDALDGKCNIEDVAAGEAFGRSLPAPAGPQVVRGAGALHVRYRDRRPACTSSCCARRTRMRASSRSTRAAALAVPGVRAVLTHEDAPAALFSTARHERAWMDPDDTRVLDDIVRFIGQKVAAVVADTEAAAEEGCRRLAIDYELLPAVFDPEDAIAPGAPVIHPGRDAGAARCQCGAQHRRGEPRRVWRCRRCASAPPRSPTKAPSRRSGFSTPRWRPMAGWPGSTPTGVLNVRSSTQVPFLTRRALSEIFRARAGQGPRVLRARRRWFWRQAGDVRRGHPCAGRAEDRPAGQARIHPRGDSSSRPRRGIRCASPSRPAPTRTAS